MENEEIWKPIPGYEALYEASNLGRVRSLDRQGKYRLYAGGVIKPSSDCVGYMSFAICKGNTKTRMKTHQAICMAFHGTAEKGMHVRHLNGDKADNRPANLRWGTRKENGQDTVSHGRSTYGERNPRAKLTDDKVREIREAHNNGEGVCSLSRKYQVSNAVIIGVYKRKIWRHVA